MYLAAVDAEVDECIASLLEHLAERGVRTRYSCQGYGDRAYILFEDAGSLERAVTALAELAEVGSQRDLRARVLQLPGHRSWDPEHGWGYEVSVQTLSCRGASLTKPHLDYVVRIPVDDLALFNDILGKLPTRAPARG